MDQSRFLFQNFVSLVFCVGLLSNGIHAISNQNGLSLTIDFLRRKLKEDQSQIREAWKNKELTVRQKHNGKLVDYKIITHKGQSFKVVQVNQDFVEKEGFDFSIHSR